jgi:SAM-dependent methyltransferase
MKNREKWQPSKYIYKRGKLIASGNRKEVGVGSRLMADLIAEFYGESLGKYAKGKLLDLGCGKVPLFIAYRQYITENICVDWENASYKNEYIDFEYDLTKVLPFIGEEFDTIILSDVLEHIPNPEQLWSEMVRILAVNGMIIMNVPFYYHLYEQPHDYYRYTEFALRRFVENSGLNLVQLKPIGGTPEIVADIFAKQFQFIPLIGNGLEIVIQYITKFFVKTALGRKLSEKTAQTFPFGYFLIAEKEK